MIAANESIETIRKYVMKENWLNFYRILFDFCGKIIFLLIELAIHYHSPLDSCKIITIIEFLF